MYDKNIYIKRREQLKKKVKSGILLFMGNVDSPMNYTDNIFPFRQDSTFLYYFGLDHPGFTAIIDIDENKEMIFGEDFSVDDIVWTGPQKTTSQLAKSIGVNNTAPTSKLDKIIKSAISSGRNVHSLPQYSHETKINLFHGEIQNKVSLVLSSLNTNISFGLVSYLRNPLL